MSATLGVVLAAAGSSRRLGFDKLFTPVLGKTVFQFTLDGLLASPDVAHIVIATSEGNVSVVQGLLPASAAKPISVVVGGAERQDSVMEGLKALDPALEYVLIQDAARPFVSPGIISAVLAAAREHGAAVCGHPSNDTLKVIGEGSTGADLEIAAVEHTVDRSRVWAVQTPQIFRRTLLVEAYAHVAAQGGLVTDDTAAVEALGQPVVIVKTDAFNGKITRRADWEIAIRKLFPFSDDVQVGSDMRKLIHDFNNQLTSLMGFAYLLDCDCPEDSPMKSSITAINEAVTKCHEISIALQKKVRDFHNQKVAFNQVMDDPQPPAPVVPPASSVAPVSPLSPLGGGAAAASPMSPVSPAPAISPLGSPISPVAAVSPLAPASPVNPVPPASPIDPAVPGASPSPISPLIQPPPPAA
ncbi:2-C-methyl-D-erythritol 4-phosphate cytidylyltransferase [Verrucomicrobium sp. GAS474]|uniref:2-C-methyl-D-erythritol 4-phosphate cytidylyltransferase n=1 Tax=Verrucomicrobium sp. GAS474 TaxID=1882831 RepID=UPI00087D0399|nr:2-C-methyl-D-erythritol 4-phosphate cytidylyltransferase [Verrucomicrobium sp. GAS474]SDU04718.1 2-C-methyl-D-erythritol 4-phosphate cytidylyltransferase [Verrucomicrobium sp. GAS474]